MTELKFKIYFPPTGELDGLEREREKLQNIADRTAAHYAEKNAVSVSKLVNTPIDSEKKRQPAKFAEIGGVSTRRLYIIRRDSSDWTPIVALISGPKSPALSTMRTRFETLYHKPKRTRKTQTDGYALAEYTWAMVDYERNLRECGYAGDSVAEYFIDWLLKTDSRFQREPYAEVNL